MSVWNIIQKLSDFREAMSVMTHFRRSEKSVATVASIAMLGNPVVRSLVRDEYRVFRWFLGRPDIAVGWGLKASGRRAIAKADSTGCVFLLLEDGFLRSAGREDRPVSTVMDDRGIYYDASHASRLEDLISSGFSDDEISRARELQTAWVAARVSKYNGAREYSGDLPDQYVLVVDQVEGDESIPGGLAGPECFDRMLFAALKENPDKTVVVKAHPDRGLLGRTGHFNLAKLAENNRILVISEPCHPVRLIAGASSIYTVTSQMGFEALLHEKPVRCFGMPFYAGWGLTDDEMEAPSRRGSASLHSLIFAALIAYPTYCDPIDESAMEPEQAIALMDAVRRSVEKTPKVLFAVGFSIRKRSILRRMCPGSKISFVRPEKVPAGASVALWGVRSARGLPGDVRIFRVEDGFLRSAGLGVNLVQPISWVVDPSGMHFDPSNPSALESALQDEDFSEAVLMRARDLRKKIVETGVTKYNLREEGCWTRPDGAEKVILVVGQVEDDASVLTGSPKIRRNVDLIKAAREIEPDAWLIYKPHPDVVAGLRVADQSLNEINHLADEVVTSSSISGLLGKVDAVHVMTSLTGFEALLRKISVTCHGIPFYAGWGLTDDQMQIKQRTRTRTIDELTAAALINYPTYSDPASGVLMTPEQAVSSLLRDAERPQKLRPGRVVRRAIVGMGQKREKLHDERAREASKTTTES
jgi:capsular polysaccharide export protein